jgi:hypothetical protein
MLMWSTLLAVFQVMAAFGVFACTFRPACASSDQCFAGSFCNVDVGRCDFCGAQFSPLALETEGTCALGTSPSAQTKTTKSSTCATYNWPEDPNFVGYNKTAVKMACADPTDRLNLGGDPVSSDGVRSWCDTW